MKQGVKQLTGFAIGATDGQLGKIKEFYFDDNTWTIRYLIVETGTWLEGRKVLISPEALSKPDWESGILPVNLTQEQVKNSPDIDTEKPVSRQQEIKLYEHYPWTSYWRGGIWTGGMGTSGMLAADTFPISKDAAKETPSTNDNNDNPYLRSTANVTGYHIQASDGEIGEVEDFIFDDRNWKIAFMVVDTGNWLPGKKVLISPDLIEEISWETTTVVVKATVQQVKSSPEYKPGNPVDDAYEASLRAYYHTANSR